MQILESWEDNQGRAHAVVQHSRRAQGLFKCRHFEAMFEFDGTLNNFGGGVGFGIADFDTAEEARQYY